MAFRMAWFGAGALAFWFTGLPVAALVLAGVFAANALSEIPAVAQSPQQPASWPCS